MTTTDWIIDIVLVLIVVRQLREEAFSLRFVLLPFGIVAYVAHAYLHTIPTGGNDLVLIGSALAAGLALGIAGGLITRVRGANGTVYVKAGFAAAALWVGSMGARLAFIVWITHSGQDALATFSIEHHITSGDAWQTALVVLALSEVIARIGIISIRSLAAAQRSKNASAAELVTV